MDDLGVLCIGGPLHGQRRPMNSAALATLRPGDDGCSLYTRRRLAVTVELFVLDGMTAPECVAHLIPYRLGDLASEVIDLGDAE